MDRVAEILKDTLGARPEIKFAYLFGSHAKGTAGKLSDIDVAVFVEDTALKADYPYGYKAMLITELMKALKTNKIDVVILNEAKPFLCSQVIKDGVLLSCNDEAARIEFWVNTLHRYNDAKWLLGIQEHYMQKRIEEGKFGR